MTRCARFLPDDGEEVREEVARYIVVVIECGQLKSLRHESSAALRDKFQQHCTYPQLRCLGRRSATNLRSSVCRGTRPASNAIANSWQALAHAAGLGKYVRA